MTKLKVVRDVGHLIDLLMELDLSARIYTAEPPFDGLRVVPQSDGSFLFCRPSEPELKPAGVNPKRKTMPEPSRKQLEAAGEVMNSEGFNIKFPWEGALDSVERRRYETFTKAIASAFRIIPEQGQ